MVLITEQPGEGVKQENGIAGGRGLGVAVETPVMSISQFDCEMPGQLDNDETEDMDNYWEDEDDVYQEFEELDFESLPDRLDTRSIASDDSFYPPDSSVPSHLLRSPSPEPVSFFKACCNNNSIIVKILIRQGVSEDEVKETDRNRRVRTSV